MTLVRNIFTFVGFAAIINGLAFYLKSDFIGPFLKDNLVNIITTLLAINIATCSLIIAKLKDISDHDGNVDFKKTYNEIKSSLFEQVVLIIVVFVLSVLASSSVLKGLKYPHQFVFDTLLTAAFIYALFILWDTGKSIFLIISNDKKN